MKSLICLQNVQKHFQMSMWKECYWEGIGNKYTTERDRRSRSVYIFLLLRYRPDFLTELFSKNVTFGARVCPPLGAGEKKILETRRDFFIRFHKCFFIFLTLVVLNFVVINCYILNNIENPLSIRISFCNIPIGLHQKKT